LQIDTLKNVFFKHAGVGDNVLIKEHLTISNVDITAQEYSKFYPGNLKSCHPRRACRKQWRRSPSIH